MQVILQIFGFIPLNPSPLQDASHNHPEKKQPLQKEKEFTLIEMMVVIVIIGILASIAIGILIEGPDFSSKRSYQITQKPKGSTRLSSILDLLGDHT